MELFLLEHKKLWRKRIVKICVLLCFIYIVIFGSILSFQWFSFGSSDDYTSALVGSGADIFRTNTFCIFGKYVWSPYLLVTVPILVGIFCMPFAVRNWSRRLKV